jgi:predicted CXXCH cytochrome family protein
LSFNRMVFFLPLVAVILLLTGMADASPCSDCHKEWLAKARTLAGQHSPFADGDCVSCHKEHGETNKLVLNAQGAKLCVDCHDDPAAGGKKVHTVVADNGCLDCHNPHSSANPKLTVKPGAKLCADCHEVPGPDQPVRHTALDDGCSGCHDPHSSANPNLLLKAYKNEKTVKTYVPKDYDLCFDCHDQALVTAEGEKSSVTGFRNGQTNLHNVHVMGPLEKNKYGMIKRGKPHACGICHSAHASDQDYVLIRQYDCGEVFCFTLNYTKEGEGGFCRVGCHKPLAYSRTGQARTIDGVVAPPQELKKP